MAEADGNRTRQRQHLPLSDFEDRAGHQTGYASVSHGSIMAGTMGAMLTSVGHGALDRAGLVQVLHSADVEALVDIRRFPNSRHNPDVEMATMAEWTRDAGLAYRWDERLGGRRRLPAGAEGPASDGPERATSGHPGRTRSRRHRGQGILKVTRTLCTSPSNRAITTEDE